MKDENMLDELFTMWQEKMSYRLDEAEIRRARKNLLAALKDPENENAILDYGIALEKCGFRNGFILATKIMSQCMDNIPVYVPQP